MIMLIAKLIRKNQSYKQNLKKAEHYKKRNYKISNNVGEGTFIANAMQSKLLFVRYIRNQTA